MLSRNREEKENVIILLYTSMDCCVLNVSPISEECNKTGRGTEMGCEGHDQRERKYLQCREWVNRVELFTVEKG